jgi:hypothetical protein
LLFFFSHYQMGLGTEGEINQSELTSVSIFDFLPQKCFSYLLDLFASTQRHAEL